MFLTLVLSSRSRLGRNVLNVFTLITKPGST